MAYTPTIRNTRDLITPDTRTCTLVYAWPKMGKTTFAATLDQMTRKFMGKPTIVIAVEAAEGGGTMSIAEFGLDYIAPEVDPADPTKGFNEIGQLLAWLRNDEKYGGVVFDSCTEYVNRFLKPWALRFPVRQPAASRAAGVPVWDDYHAMGEQGRIHLNQMVGLTTHPDPKKRKHLLVTATRKEKSNENGGLVKVYPELPGALADAATAMFQTVGTVELEAKLEKDAKGKVARTMERWFVTEGDGVKVLGDRTKRLTGRLPLDWVRLWEEYWLPGLQPKAAEAA